MGGLDYTRKRGTSIYNTRVNRITLTIFAPLLILVGVAGFVIPAQESLTSGAPPYNVFHVFFGSIGLIILWTRKDSLISLFNLGFGLIDLYQAVASYVNLSPKQYFMWTKADDILHVVLGLALVIIGGYGIVKRRDV